MPKGTGKGAASKMGRRYEDLTGGALAVHDARGRETITSPPSSEGVVYKYSDEAYTAVNGDLRRGISELAGPQGEIQAGLDAMFKKPGATLQQDARLYRGIGENDPIFTQLRAGTLRAGTVFEDKGFMSTSVGTSAPINFFSGSYQGDPVVLRIRAKKGKRAVHIDSLSANKGEGETLLPRGSKIRVKGVSQGTVKGERGGSTAVTFIDVDLM